MVAVTTYGQLQAEMVESLLNMRSHTEAQGLHPAWIFVPGTLVDRARNTAVIQFLGTIPPLGWLLFVDGDAVFAPDALYRLLQYAYGDFPQADAVGGYCTLRPDPYLPTIDTGTGTWESWLPGQGAIEVIRTGSAFILLKRHCFEQVSAPWYGTRHPMRPLDAMAEVDNWAHTRFDGRNPLTAYPEWQALLKCARDDPASRQRPDPSAFVGEDSNWCDRMRFAGLRIFVHTDIEVRHVTTTLRSAADHRRVMQERERTYRTLVGLCG